VQGMVHPLSGALYDVVGAGVIEVSKEGRSGRYDAHGRWISGDRMAVDPHLCVWLGGVQLPSRYERLITTDPSPVRTEGNPA
jgi:hypothetical protein